MAPSLGGLWMTRTSGEYLRYACQYGCFQRDCTHFCCPIQWHILFQGAIPAKILLDKNDVIQGYDYWGTDQRTYVITRFFNIILGTIGSEVFDFPSS
jgi:hypothetical protein